MGITVLSTAAAIPLGNYPNGSFTSPVVDIPDAATDVEFDIAACTSAQPTIWPNSTTTLTLETEFSLDGGASFISGGGFNNAPGGVHKNKLGQEIPIDTFTTSIPSGSGRKARATFTIAGGPLRSSCSAKWLQIT